MFFIIKNLGKIKKLQKRFYLKIKNVKETFIKTMVSMTAVVTTQY